ncbi:hypothetical protein FQN54_006666 [Arachnomyces sp. PD_36]|nr:hypothetical protein FQN54_006666 [Arachnomyces sp. PD_36]
MSSPSNTPSGASPGAPSGMEAMIAKGPPYPPMGAAVGGQPSTSVDIPISAVFIVLFAIGAASHMTVFQRNQKRGHKFIPSAATFGFCMARIIANVMRIVWAKEPTNARVAIAAQVFVAAGVIVLFLLNVLFAQRMLRASHPRLGWSRITSYFFLGLYTMIIVTLAMVITATVQSLYTLNNNTRRIDRDLQLYGSTYFTFISFLPIPILAYSYLAPRKPGQQLDSFGEGSWTTKALIVATASFCLCLGAGFRTGTTFMAPRPQTDPAWYHHKACFYVFNFALEAFVMYMYLFMRVDKRFYVPDGSSKVRSFSGELNGVNAEKVNGVSRDSNEDV